jgi:hypothetical protein
VIKQDFLGLRNLSYMAAVCPLTGDRVIGFIR